MSPFRNRKNKLQFQICTELVNISFILSLVLRSLKRNHTLEHSSLIDSYNLVLYALFLQSDNLINISKDQDTWSSVLHPTNSHQGSAVTEAGKVSTLQQTASGNSSSYRMHFFILIIFKVLSYLLSLLVHNYNKIIL